MKFKRAEATAKRKCYCCSSDIHPGEKYALVYMPGFGGYSNERGVCMVCVDHLITTLTAIKEA